MKKMIKSTGKALCFVGIVAVCLAATLLASCSLGNIMEQINGGLQELDEMLNGAAGTYYLTARSADLPEEEPAVSAEPTEEVPGEEVTGEPTPTAEPTEETAEKTAEKTVQTETKVSDRSSYVILKDDQTYQFVLDGKETSGTWAEGDGTVVLTDSENGENVLTFLHVSIYLTVAVGEEKLTFTKQIASAQENSKFLEDAKKALAEAEKAWKENSKKTDEDQDAEEEKAYAGTYTATVTDGDTVSSPIQIKLIRAVDGSEGGSWKVTGEKDSDFFLYVSEDFSKGGSWDLEDGTLCLYGKKASVSLNLKPEGEKLVGIGDSEGLTLVKEQTPAE